MRVAARSSGSAPARSGATRASVALYFRDDAAAIGPPPYKGDADRRRARARRRCASGSPRRRASSPTCSPSSPLAPEELQEALWDLVWAGEVTNDAWAPLRAPRLTLARAQRGALRDRGRAGRRFGARRGGAQAQVQGRWSLTAALFRARARARPAPPHARRAAARALRHRHPRAGARRGRSPAASRSLYDALVAARDARRLPPRLLRRGPRRRAVRAARRGRAAARAAELGARTSRRSCSPRPTRRSPTARRCRGPSATTRSTASRQRVAGAYVVLVGAEPVALRRARRPRAARSLVEADDARVRAGARGARRRSSPATARSKLSLERVDGEPVVGSRLGAAARRARLPPGPRKLTLSA